MNLTQTQVNAKQAFLNKQAEKMLAHYKQVNQSERKAIIKQIDSFLEVISKDERKILTFEHELVSLYQKYLQTMNEVKLFLSDLIRRESGTQLGGE